MKAYLTSKFNLTNEYKQNPHCKISKYFEKKANMCTDTHPKRIKIIIRTVIIILQNKNNKHAIYDLSSKFLFSISYKKKLRSCISNLCKQVIKQIWLVSILRLRRRWHNGKNNLWADVPAGFFRKMGITSDRVYKGYAIYTPDIHTDMNDQCKPR